MARCGLKFTSRPPPKPSARFRPPNHIAGAERVRFDQPCIRDTDQSVGKTVCLATPALEFWTKQPLRRIHLVIGMAKGRGIRDPLVWIPRSVKTTLKLR